MSHLAVSFASLKTIPLYCALKRNRALFDGDGVGGCLAILSAVCVILVGCSGGAAGGVLMLRVVCWRGCVARQN